VRSVEITVMGRTFTIKTDESDEHVKAVSNYVDGRYNELLGGAKVPPQNIAVLTALTLADELIKERMRHRALKEAVRLRGSTLVSKIEQGGPTT
jgi:cell division protein ZapA (FtsZ GTPase activity inhibitor)